MSEHFNKLTPAEAEVLALLAEECGEAIQVVGKILRHGIDSCHPNNPVTNRALLESELGDIAAASRLLSMHGLIDPLKVEYATGAKFRKVHQYLHHAAVVQLTSNAKPILTEEEIRAAASKYTTGCWTELVFSDTQSFIAGARFALLAAEKREALWRELLQTSEGFCDHGQDCTDCDTDAQVALASRYRELRAALGLEGVR